MKWGFLKGFIALFIFLLINQAGYTKEKIGIVSDAVLKTINAYNAYYKTPEFFLQDVRADLMKKDVEVVGIRELQYNIDRLGFSQRDIEALYSLQQGYDLDYETLKRVAYSIGVKKLIVLTSSIDIQRDFLKNTLWNVLNIPGFDTINPTQRLSVYVAFVDTEKEVVIWEEIFAKDIRNNKFRNLDTAISSNYEGMLRLKEYSKYISPIISKQVVSRLEDPNYVTPKTKLDKANVVKYLKDKKNVGSQKKLTDIDNKYWYKEKKVKEEELQDTEVNPKSELKEKIIKQENL